MWHVDSSGKWKEKLFLLFQAVLNDCKLNCEYTSSDGDMLTRKSFNAENGIACNRSGVRSESWILDKFSSLNIDWMKRNF